VHACRVASNRAAAEELRLVGIDAPADLRAKLRVPGQYVLAGRARGPHAFFVLCSPVDSTGPWEILVRAGAPAADAIGALSEGTSLEVSAPLGAGFPMERVFAHERDVLLVCAGSGIAALLPVLHALRARRGRLDGVRLLQGVQTRAHAAFRAEIDRFCEAGLAAKLCVTREDPPEDAVRGHVQDALRAHGAPLADALVLAAGPFALIQTLRTGFPDLGLQASAVLTNFG
jgi:NAD(P)H-flavin reductase